MKNLSVPVFILLFLFTACSINTTSMQPSPVIDVPSDAFNTPSETPVETPVYIPIQEQLDVTALDLDTVGLSHLTDDERELVEIAMIYLTAYLDNDLKSIEPYLDDSFLLEIRPVTWIISKIILKWNVEEISHEKSVMAFEFHLSNYEFYLYMEIYFSKTSGEWKIYDSSIQP